MKIFQNILLALALATTLSVTAQNYPQKTINGQKFYEYTMEKQEGFLQNAVVIGSYDEAWSLKKVLRRFLWHDRIHAKAMYRMAVKTFGEGSVPDVFRFMG